MITSTYFEENILFCFKDLIEEFGLQLTKPYENGNTYLLIGKKCNIRFSYDRGETGCAFEPTAGQPFITGFQVNSICDFLHPYDRLSDMGTSDYYDQKLQLSWYASIIAKDLKNVLAGDFGWLNDYIKKKDMHGYLVALTFHLGNNHPIYKKFVSNDDRWRAEAEKYAFDNNFIQP